jgi:hypothetical protein
MKRQLLLGAAIAAMFANCSFAQVLLDENFDDGLAASRFTVNVVKSNTNTGTNPTATFNYDYSTFMVDHYAFPSTTVTSTAPIPAAPGGTTTIGLKMQNVPIGSGANAGMNLAVLPNAVNVSGDFRIEGWVWQNYNGGPNNFIAPGAIGSTEGIQVGLNRSGTAGASGFQPTGTTRSPGYGFMITTEGGNAGDYAMYSSDTGDDGQNFAKRNGAWQGGVRENRVSFTDPNNILATGFTDHPGNHLNTYNRNEVFPAADGYEVPGAPAKKWTKFVMEQRGNITTMSMNGKIMMTLFNSAAFSGTPQFSYLDINNGSIPDPADSNFSVYDNLKVTQLTAAPINTVGADDYAVFNTSGALGNATLRGLSVLGASNVSLSGNLTMSGEGSAIYAPEGQNALTGTLTLNSDTAIMVGNNSGGVPPTIPANGSTLTLSSGITAAPGAHLTKTGMGQLNVPFIRAESFTHVDGKTVLTGAGPANASRLKGYGQEYLGTTAAPGVSLIDIGKTVVQVDYVPRTNPDDVTQSNSPFALLQANFTLGFGSGTWDGTRGITSSAMASAPANIVLRLAESSTLGYADGATWGATGLPIDASAVVFGYTYVADTNLDQAINFDDLLKLARNYDVTGLDPFVSWASGDSNADGNVNFDDLLKLAQLYGSTVSLLGVSMDEELNGQFASDWAMALSIVPEPTSLSALALGGLVLRRRR